jgi:ergothioneine biosynthesis protein EgtB
MMIEQYNSIRADSECICKPLETEDYVVQPVVDVSPPKWHLGHTSWFFETFLLKPFYKNYKEFDPDYNFVFNSYYETIGTRVIRTDRGNLSRPTVQDVYAYRKYIDESMREYLSSVLSSKELEIVQLGLNHEQQHQELLYTDIKYILGHNPLFPKYADCAIDAIINSSLESFVDVPSGLYSIGYEGNEFCYDNELGRHTVYLSDYSIASSLVSNKEYLEFIEDGGYNDFRFWHAEGWDEIKSKKIQAPLYWHIINGEWYIYTLNGLKKIDLLAPVCHVSYYEAAAFADWKGMRLPTEFEWEVAAPKFSWGKRWEWTGSAYLPYPGYKKAPGALGEYNGKFMINQMVLRGASVASSKNHSRISYRNFFHPHLRWQFAGIRLAK